MAGHGPLRMHDYVTSLLAFSAAARLSSHRGDPKAAHRQLTRAMQARLSATYVLPFVAVRLRLQLARVYLALAEQGTVRQLLREIDDIVSRRSALGTLIDEIRDFRDVLASDAAPKATGTLPLTPAELRLLPYLQTHLTADKIAERLFVSSHTVKTQIKTIYRKLASRPGTTRCNERQRSACSAASRRHRRDRLIIQYPYQGDAGAAVASPQWRQ